MERLTKTIYVSNDGKEFDSAADCEKHEKKIKDRKALTTYWSVSHSPDLTEGRGWQGLYLVECYGPKIDARTWIEDWCYRKFGRPLAFVQGVSPMANWIVSQINENQFRLDQKACIGDQTFGAKRIRLVAGSLEAGLIEGVLEGDK